MNITKKLKQIVTFPNNLLELDLILQAICEYGNFHTFLSILLPMLFNVSLKWFTIIFQKYLTILSELAMKSLIMFYLSNLKPFSPSQTLNLSLFVEVVFWSKDSLNLKQCDMLLIGKGLEYPSI